MKPWKFLSRLFGLSPEAWLLSLLRERLDGAEDGTYHFTIGRAAVLRLEGQTWVADIHIRRLSSEDQLHSAADRLYERMREWGVED